MLPGSSITDPVDGRPARDGPGPGLRRRLGAADIARCDADLVRAELSRTNS
jgi:hypothetical protein